MDWIQSTPEEEKIFEAVEPLLKGLGYCIVELRAKRIHDGTLRIHLVIHKPSGVSIAGCSEVYKAVLPLLNISQDTQDIHLEVSSPGVSRTVKQGRELACFIGQAIAYMRSAGSEWTYGRLQEAGPERIVIRTEQEELTVPLSDLKKAKLV